MHALEHARGRRACAAKSSGSLIHHTNGLPKRRAAARDLVEVVRGRPPSGARGTRASPSATRSRTMSAGSSSLSARRSVSGGSRVSRSRCATCCQRVDAGVGAARRRSISKSVRLATARTACVELALHRARVLLDLPAGVARADVLEVDPEPCHRRKPTAFAQAMAHGDAKAEKPRVARDSLPRAHPPLLVAVGGWVRARAAAETKAHGMPLQ